MTADGPNVVLVVLDTARCDAFEPYGAAAGATPAIADLARRGRAVADVYATANWTLPSHVSMLTGALPRQAGLNLALGEVAETGRNAAAVTSLASRFLPAVLAEAGWEVRGASANPWISEANGFAAGYREFREVAPTRRVSPFALPQPDDGRLSRDLKRKYAAMVFAAEAFAARADDGAAALLDELRSMLATRDRTRPFFWFFNVMECHSPYLPPRRFSRLGPTERVRASADHRRYGTSEATGQVNCGYLTVPEEVLDRMRRGYAGAVSAADAWVGALLEELTRAGLLDDTIVIVTSDHGENLGESGRIAHAVWLDDRLIRVPLVYAGPADLAVTGATSLASLPALVAEAVGVAGHPWERDRTPGVAVAQSDAIVRPDDPRLADAIKQHDLDDDVIWRMTTSSTCAVDGRLKLVREGDDDWLFDLQRDPAEVAPIRVDGRSILEWGDAVRTLRAAVDAAAPRDGVGPAASSEGWRAPVADADLSARLRMLGYL
ncbi:MAG TPA: sulfatase-like hydrolase/transferase [Mycobacteriales bacterium]|nr:sulfatase-like hydrolase/transferase [Mycobacteriales bacterium]